MNKLHGSPMPEPSLTGHGSIHRRRRISPPAAARDSILPTLHVAGEAKPPHPLSRARASHPDQRLLPTPTPSASQVPRATRWRVARLGGLRCRHGSWLFATQELRAMRAYRLMSAGSFAFSIRATELWFLK